MSRQTNLKNKSRYALVCQGCGWTTRDDPHLIHCPSCEDRAFLRSVYDVSSLPLDGPTASFTSYRSWLPCEMVFSPDDLQIGCLHAERLGASLGVENLFLLLSCYAPEYGGTLPSATFKSLEAAGVMLRVLSQTDRTLIISSAGNAGAAVLELGTRYGCPAVVVVPKSARRDMVVSGSPGASTPLLLCLEDATYPDAIQFVDRIHKRFSDRLVREGGAFNVARRDAMGIPVLRAVQEIKAIPNHYVQAVGSGTGGISAQEAVLRMKQRGPFAHSGPMRLHLVQNIPFAPMVDAWKAGKRTVDVMSREEIHWRLGQTYSKVLANANPPYGVAGGVYDWLVSSGGDMVGVTNEEAATASDQLMRFYDFHPSPETAVALAGLVKQIQSGVIARNETVLLHATGGGAERCTANLNKKPYPVARTLAITDIDEACRVIAEYLEEIRRSPSDKEEPR